MAWLCEIGLHAWKFVEYRRECKRCGRVDECDPYDVAIKGPIWKRVKDGNRTNS